MAWAVYRGRSAGPAACLIAIADSERRLVGVLCLEPDRLVHASFLRSADALRVLERLRLHERQPAPGHPPYPSRWLEADLAAIMPADLWVSPPLGLDDPDIWVDLGTPVSGSLGVRLMRGRALPDAPDLGELAV